VLPTGEMPFENHWAILLLLLSVDDVPSPNTSVVQSYLELRDYSVSITYNAYLAHLSFPRTRMSSSLTVKPWDFDSFNMSRLAQFLTPPHRHAWMFN
jgi:hypothetical protein